MSNRTSFSFTTLFLMAAACGGASERGTVSHFPDGVSVRGEKFAGGRIETVLSNEEGERFVLAFDGRSRVELTPLFDAPSETVELDPTLIGEEIEAWNKLTYDAWVLTADSPVRVSISNIGTIPPTDTTTGYVERDCMTRCMAAPETTFWQCRYWCGTR